MQALLRKNFQSEGEKPMNLSTIQIEEITEGIFGALVSSKKIGVSAIELVLNDACNLSCTYCFEKNKTSKRFMSFDIGRQSIDRLLDINDNRKILYFFGGEPFLSWRVMRSLILYARKRESSTGRLGMSVTTNGTIIPKGAFDILRENQVGVLVSIDAGKEVHDKNRIFKTGRGSYDLVIRNLEGFISNGLQTSVRITVEPGYTYGVIALVKHCIELGVTDVVIGAMLPADWQESQIKEYCSTLEMLSVLEKQSRINGVSHVRVFDDYKGSKKTCAAGTTLLAVSPEGNLFGCSRLLMADDGKGVACLGNIQDFSLDMSAQKLINEGTKISGCAAVNFDTHNNILQASRPLLALDDALRRVAKKFHAT